ncbi:MAG: bifunctional DNA-formamidopyrimidine glycosylase/DNA-(apurinic or apyrimidinic site) lyase [Chloroflexi bacterium]|nr:bifunctional DNA-formamidopyrimidine glycosylase/DNA-(apurinic or apyrimidinic site) lyase [Chloroflexota bacterium]
MPELPEVECIAAALRQGKEGQPPLIGKAVLAAQVLWPRTLQIPSPQEFTARIAGQVIRQIGRRGKFLVFTLDRDTLLLHLRMSGDLWVEAADAPVAIHHRLLLNLEGGLRLAFNDARKFGRAWLLDDPQSVLGGLGREPLEEDFTPQELAAMLRARRRQLKPLLLDQAFLAGMGNIYTDEALHSARLHPLTLSDRLSYFQAAALHRAIREALQEGIRRNGASIDWVYRGGDFQNSFQVYQRDGQPCLTCGTTIQRITLGQRGTHFCPVCQPLE